MGMYKTRALTKEQYIEIIDLIKKGGYLDTRPNEIGRSVV